MRRFVAGLAMLALATSASAAPKAELWQRWTAHGEKAEAIDHSAWTAFLKTYVKPGDDGINRLAYGKVTNADRQALKAYLQALQSLKISDYPRPQQYAYWANLYNAETVAIVLEHYPVASIRDIDISPGFFSSGPWGAKRLTVEGEKLSLNDIEHRILRPIWGDPRTHYAVNCASLGCPNLQTQAFTAETMGAMLDQGARDYINHPRGARVENGRLKVSSIYVWFQSDFGGNDAGVIKHLRQYAEPKLKSALEGIDKIADDHYDWSLNDAS